MIVLLVSISTFMLLSAYCWIYDLIANHNNVSTTIAKTLLVIVLILSSIAIIICAYNLNTKKCECGTKIESSWEYCANCGKEIGK